MDYTPVIDQRYDYLILNQRTHHLKVLPSILHSDAFFSGSSENASQMQRQHLSIFIADIHFINQNL